MASRAGASAPPAGRSPVVLVTRVGAASGSAAVAAALAHAASESDRAALLVDLDGGRAPRPSLVATAGARRLEERLAAHMPEAEVASRGSTCRLRLPADPASAERIAAALPLARASAAVIHLPPALLRATLEEPRIPAGAALLRADLASDRPLTALVAGDLIERGLRVAVLKRQPGRLAARLALFGLPPIDGFLPARLSERLLDSEDNRFRDCYDRRDGAEDERQETTEPRRYEQGSK